MDERMLGIFQREVARQARFALRAAADIDAVAEELGNPPRTLDMEAVRDANDRLWSNAQLFFGAVANLSKLLWGKGESQAMGRDNLRSSLGVAEDSPLRSRQARNDMFEHLDEELLKWAREWGPEALVFDATSGSVQRYGDADPIADEPTGEPGYLKHHLRYYDRGRRRFLFRGKAYDFDALQSAVRNVAKSAERVAPYPL